MCSMRFRHHLPAIAVAITALALAGCGGGGGGGAGDGGLVDAPNGAGTTTEPGTPAAPIRTVTAQTIPAPVASTPPQPDRPCAPGEGRTIPGVDIPAVHEAAVHVPGVRAGDTVIPAVVLPAVDLPAQRIPTQCERIAPAPAGCLGAVTIPAVTIPGVGIPGVRIPGVDVPGLQVSEVSHEPVVRAPVQRAAVHRDRVCARKVRPGDARYSVVRYAAVRYAAVRYAAVRYAVTRYSKCRYGTSQICAPAVTSQAVTTPAATSPAVTSPAATIRDRVLPEVTSRCVKVASGAGQTDYAVCTDVLFAFGKATLRARARAVLLQVARSLAKRFPRGRIEVDGHTDSKGGAGYNRGLSERRAAAVKAFLAGHGVEAARMTARGYGETRPVAPNTSPGGGDNPAGRARNRRVVVGVLEP